MWVQLKKKQKDKKKWAQTEAVREAESKRDFFIFLFSSLGSLFDIRKSDRRNSSGQERKCSTHGNQKHGISLSFQLDLRLSDGQNWSEHEVKLIHTSRATREYQKFGVSSNSTRYGFSSKYINYTYTNT